MFEQKRRKGMPSVKRSIWDISLEKTFSMGSPDLLKTGIRERVSRTVKCEYRTHAADIDPNLYTTLFGDDSNKINIFIKKKKPRKWKEKKCWKSMK